MSRQGNATENIEKKINNSRVTIGAKGIQIIELSEILK